MTLPILPERSGVLVAVDTRAVGLVVLALGGGRRRAGQAIEHAVGLTAFAAVGEAVGPERPIALVHARSREHAERAAKGKGKAKGARKAAAKGRAKGGKSASGASRGAPSSDAAR